MLRRLFGGRKGEGDTAGEESSARREGGGPEGVAAGSPAVAVPGGAKLRVFMTPPGAPSFLFELALEPEPSGGAHLRCFSPPPGRGRSDEDTRAWTVALEPAALAEVRERLDAVRLLPMGAATLEEGEGTVELTVAEGQAEVTLRWWRRAPDGWQAAADLVERLRALAVEAAS